MISEQSLSTVDAISVASLDRQKVGFALKSIKAIVDQASLYYLVNRTHRQNQDLWYKLNDFKLKAEEYKRLLNEAISSKEFWLQNELEAKIREFKNIIGRSISIREYLIASKYTQLQCITDPENFVSNHYIEQQLAKRIWEAREQIHQCVEKEFSEK